MIDDDVEDLVETLRGRVCAIDNGTARWRGRLAGSTSADDKISILFEAPAGEAMVMPLTLSRQNTVRGAFEPAAGPAGRRTRARLVVHTRDGVLTVAEDDPAKRPERTPPASTKQGLPPQRFTTQGAPER
jgi:hypothetical protein